MIPGPDLVGRRLLSGQYLATNEYINSENWAFFAIQQADGHFCVYQGTGPGDNRGLVWCTDVVGEAGEYVAVMQEDGNFGVYRGTSLKDLRDVLWHAGGGHPGGYSQLKIQDDGNLVLAETWNADVRDKTYWNCGSIASALEPFQIDQATRKERAVSLGRIWQSFTPSRSGELVGLDLRLWVYDSPAQTQTVVLSVHAGDGRDGAVLARQKISIPRHEQAKPPFQHYALERPPRLAAGTRYSLEVHREESLSGPFVGLCDAADYPAERGRCELASDTLVFRTCMRTLQPTWNHPVG